MAKLSQFSFAKDEKLCSVKIIESLIQNGNKIINQPFRLVWNYYELPVNVAVQVLFIVPKRNIKLAVTRNRIKRQMREIYRLQKHHISGALSKNDQQVALVLFFNGKKQPSWKEMESKIILLLQRFEETIHALHQ